jgi:hypothetical protein
MVTKQALDEDIIVVGDRVDLVVQMGQVYRAMIEDRIDNGPFLLGIPSNKGIPMHVEQDDDIYLVFYRESGRYVAQMSVVALEKRGTIRYMWLLQKTKAQQNQRRGAFRLPVSFGVRIYEYSEEMEKGLLSKEEEAGLISLEAINSRDISVTGISLLTKKPYELEEKYILSMQLDMTPASVRSRQTGLKIPETQMTATVKRCIPWRTGKMFNTGMHFFGMTRSMSENLARYVMTEQQRQIKKRRLYD